jgi:hypothetical protein
MAVNLEGNEFHHYDELMETSLIPSPAEVSIEHLALSKEYPNIDWAIEEYYAILERDGVAKNKVAASHFRAFMYGAACCYLGGVFLPVGAACAVLAGSWFIIPKKK